MIPNARAFVKSITTKRGEFNTCHLMVCTRMHILADHHPLRDDLLPVKIPGYQDTTVPTCTGGGHVFVGVGFNHGVIVK